MKQTLPNQAILASMTNLKKPAKFAAIAAAAVAAIAVLGGSVYTVQEGTRGVILRNGKLVGIAEPGLGIKMPVIDTVPIISLQNRSRVFTGMPAYSLDQQRAVMNVSVNYRVPPDKVDELYRKYGTIDSMVNRLIDRQIPDFAKTVFGKFTASESIRNRDKIPGELLQMLRAASPGPIIIDSVQVESVKFSDVYEQGVEQRMLAEVSVEKERQVRERESVLAEIQVIKAKADADSTLLRANAEADAMRVKGLAAAEAITARGRALSGNTAVVELTKAERWDGKLPNTMLGNAVPMVNMK